MKILTKMRLHTPSTSIRNSDELLTRKLKRNSNKLRSAQDSLARRSGNSKRLQKRVMQLQAKESFLISTRDLKTKFMISAPEDFDEHTDMKAEQEKIYKNMQSSVQELYRSLETNMHSSEGVTASMAVKRLGENIGIARSLLVLISKELIPMAHKGTGLQGYYALRRDLQSLISDTQDSYKSLLKAIGKEGAKHSQETMCGILLTPDQNDALQMTSKMMKNKLAMLSTLLEISRTEPLERVSEDGTLTEDGRVLGESIKTSLREMLNLLDISRDQRVNGNVLAASIPYLCGIDISALNLSMEREGNDVAKEKMKNALGDLFGKGVMEVIESPPDSVQEQESDENISNDIESREVDTGEGKMVCYPFAHCMSTDDVIQVLEKLASMTLDDGTPAIDMQSVCIMLTQAVKKEIEMSNNSVFVIGKPFGRHMNYMIGRNLSKNEELEMSALDIQGDKGNLVNSYLPYGENRVSNIRESYFFDVARSVDSLTGIIQSIGNSTEFNSLLQAVELKDEFDGKDDEEVSNLNIKVSPSKSLPEREVGIESSYIPQYMEQMQRIFEGGMTRSDIIKTIGIPTESSLLLRMLESDFLRDTFESKNSKIINKGLNIFMEWIASFPDSTMSRESKNKVFSLLESLLKQYMKQIYNNFENESSVNTLLTQSVSSTTNTISDYQNKCKEYESELKKVSGLSALSELDKFAEAVVLMSLLSEHKKKAGYTKMDLV
ncbi:MAG: hypothetical protein K2M30_04460 [Desulfovibrionaceae bacterium]|nr:hypothetical protein [Desulfovibrionaceae bacterium]